MKYLFFMTISFTLFMDQTIEGIEEREGIRLTWNIWPSEYQQQDSPLIPIAILYNILQNAVTLPYEPIFCYSCKSILCPQCSVDYNNLLWTCIFCNSKNKFPDYLRDITQENLLPELTYENSTVEYSLEKKIPLSPTFFFIIDTCTIDKQRHTLQKNAIRKALELLPDDVNIGIIEYGINVNLLDLTGGSIKTVYTFSGEVAYEEENLKTLNISDIRNFFTTKRDAKDIIMGIIDGLEEDPFPKITGFNKRRATGAAISFALSFVEAWFKDSIVKYLLFTQDASTFGPGKVGRLDESLVSKEPLDLTEAKSFYEEIAKRMSKLSHSIDVISATIHDIGIEQFKPLLMLNGGIIIMAQDFDEKILMESIEKLFSSEEDNSLSQVFGLQLQVKTTENIKYNGIIGDGTRSGNGWKVGCAFPTSNYTILLTPSKNAKPNTYGYVQIISQYKKSDKSIITRVTTFGRMFTNNRNDIIMGFDQIAASVLQARLFLKKNFTNTLDLEASLDKNLIQFIRRYATYEMRRSDSVVLPETMSYFPNFMYFFRRSLLVQAEGISPDEHAYFCILLDRLKPSEAIKMIKPTLISFHTQGDVSAVELDASSLDPESILVLDSFHNVLLWKGRFVDDWINNNLHLNPEYIFFKNIIEEAYDYAESLRDKLPVPQYRETSEGKSQSRILLHYINPNQKGIVNTEKIDYERFYSVLCKYVTRED